jgi:hypothetical protein
MSGWVSIGDQRDDQLPEMDEPVWLFLPARASWRPSMVIGCRADNQNGHWYWCRCYDDVWYDDRDGRWKTCTAEPEDYRPTHWMALPMPPEKER